jgi:hypothetical protein
MKTIEKVVNIPKRLTRGKDLVVLTKEEYEHIIKHRDESLKLLSIIAEGEIAYREGKTICASSLEKALKLHAKH